MEVRRQQKITYLFGKAMPVQNAMQDTGSDERLMELLEDNKRLKKELMSKDLHAFQLEKSLLPQPRLFQAKHQAAINSEISCLGGESMMRSKLSKQKERLDTYLRLFGVQVKTYTNERCVLLYNVRIKGKLIAQYGIQFTKPAAATDWTVFKYHMPLGLSLSILSEQPMSLEYLRELQTALVAYHDREEQIAKLKEVVPSHVYVTHNLSGTYVEIAFPMIERGSTGIPIQTAMELKYDPFQHRPNDVKIIQNLVTQYSEEFEAALSNQFEVLKYFNLSKGFLTAIEKDSGNNFYCPTEDEHEHFEMESLQRFPERIPQRMIAIEDKSPYDQDETVIHNPKRSTKVQENIDATGSVSDSEESVSFNTLRRQMKEIKQKKQAASTFKKPLAPKGGQKKRVEKEQVDDSDSNISDNVVLKEPNKKTNNTSNTRISSYQVTDDDLTTGSYVFIPESKKKPTKKSTRRSKGNNDSRDKENGAKGKISKSKSKK